MEFYPEEAVLHYHLALVYLYMGNAPEARKKVKSGMELNADMVTDFKTELLRYKHLSWITVIFANNKKTSTK